MKPPTTHLIDRQGSLCRRPSRYQTGSLDVVTCDRCLTRLDRMVSTEQDAWAERDRLRRVRATADRVGLGDIYTFVTARDDAIAHLTTGIVAALAMYLDESGFVLEASAAA